MLKKMFLVIVLVSLLAVSAIAATTTYSLTKLIGKDFLAADETISKFWFDANNQPFALETTKTSGAGNIYLITAVTK